MLLGGQVLRLKKQFRLTLVEPRWLAPVANLPCSLQVLIEQPLEPAVFYSLCVFGIRGAFPGCFCRPEADRTG